MHKCKTLHKTLIIYTKKWLSPTNAGCFSTNGIKKMIFITFLFDHDSNLMYV